MADASAQHPAPLPATVADVMHPLATTAEQNDHVAAAAYCSSVMPADAMARSFISPTVAEPHVHALRQDRDRRFRVWLSG